MEMRYRSKLRGALAKVLVLSVFLVALLALPPASPIQAKADDYSDKKSEATLLRTDGTPRVGTINSDTDLLDVDYFKFETERGIRYTFELEFVARGNDTLKDAQIKVLNSTARGSTISDGQVESRTEGMKIVTWVARTADTYFFTVSTAYATGTTNPYLGQYRLTVREEANLEDFHLDARDQSERMTFGSQYQGAISPWSNQPGFSGTVHGGDDYDFFNFDAVRGAKYTFDATLDGMDVLRIEVTNQGGMVLATNKGQGSSLEWIASTAGLYYVTLTGSPLARQPVGAYTLRVDQDSTLRDRYPESQSSAQPVILGNFLQGAVSPRDDKDYFSFSVQRGVKYAIETDLAEGGAVHIEVRNGSNEIEGTNRGIGSSLEWTASTQGEMYIGISASLQLKDPVVAYNFRITGDNTLQDRHADTMSGASPVNLGVGMAASISPPGDKDYFSIVALRGVQYTLQASLGSIPGLRILIKNSDGVTEANSEDITTGMGWIAPSEGTYYVVVSGLSQDYSAVGSYNIEVESDNTTQDRHADTMSGASPVNLGVGMAASISPPGDKDYFSIVALRGVQYTLQASLGSIPGLRILIKNSDGVTEANSEDITTGMGWIAPSEGTYYVVVSGLSQDYSAVGSYNIEVESDNTTQDRHADTKGNATPIHLGIGMAAAISPAGDRDHFEFTAQRGVSYTVVASLGSIPGLRVQIASSDREIETSTDDVGGGVVWTAPDDGTYYVIASGLSQRDEAVGTYNLRVDGNNSLQDRHGDDRSGATTVGYGNLVSGAISPEDDQDYFSFDAKRGVEYTFTLAYDGLEAVSLTVEGEGDHSGVLATNFGQGLDVVWVAPDDGEYFLLVSKSPMVIEGSGTYTLEIAADTSLEDRHEDDYRFATRIGVGSAISAAISPADDQDYFLFPAEKDSTYSLIVELGTAESVIMTISNHDSGFTKTNYGSGDALEWTAPAKGDYIVLVTGAALVEDPVGTYKVTMRRGELPDTPVTETVPEATPEIQVAAPETQTQPENPPVPSGATLRVGSRIASPNSTLLVPIRLEKGEQVGSLGFNANYDPTVARAIRVYRGARMSPATFSFNAATPGLIRIGAAAHDAVTGDGSAAVIEFRIVGKRGSYSDITLTDMEVSDFSGARRSIDVHHGSLTVDAAGVGDGNGDGRITAVDALIAMRMFTGLVNEDLVMDVNGDGRVTPVDSMQVLNLARRG